MRKLCLGLGLLSLAFSVACGSGGSSTINPPPPVGNFSNGSLSGQYAYSLRGTDLNTGGDFRESGVFTADGSGHITSGTDDFEEGTAGVSTDTISGTYTVRNDGIAVATINFGAGGSIALAFTLVNSTRLYVTEVDSFATAGGSAVQQNPTAFAAAPSGIFTFRNHTENASAAGSTASVGVFTAASGVVTGNEDVLRGGVESQLTLTGLLNPPDLAGRGTGSFNDGVATFDFIYYVVDASTIRFMASDPSVLGLGVADKQSGGGTFSNATLTGNYVFAGHGDTSTTDGVNIVGVFTAAGDGTLNSGVFDGVQDGTTSTNVSFSTGTYNLAANGRGTATLNATTGTIQQIFWMVSSNRAYFLVNDPNIVEDGSIDQQQAATYSNSSLNGQYAFLTHGFTFQPATFDRVGTLVSKGNENLTLNYFLNNTGVVSTSPISLTGTYSVASNGRATGSVPTLSSNLVFYLISPSTGYILQNDTGAEIDGNLALQQ
jgi:hypothetical protein